MHDWQKKQLSIILLLVNKQTKCKLVLEDISWHWFHPSLLVNKQTTKCTKLTGFLQVFHLFELNHMAEEDIYVYMCNNFLYKVEFLL